MSIGHGRGRIHPALLRVVGSEIEGLELSQRALDVVAQLLEAGSAAIPPSEYEVEGPRTSEVVSQLLTILPEISSRLQDRARGGEVDDRMLASVLVDYCPFPPFCYGQSGPDPSTGGAGRPTPDEVRIKRQVPLARS